MLFLIKRSFHTKRVPSYNGYWSLILDQANNSANEVKVEVARKPIAVPIVDLQEPTPIVKSSKKIVFLKGKPIELPEKPESPDNCCMSGCVNCVWDIYQEDMEEYNLEKKEIKNKFIEANEPVPKELESSKTDEDPMAGMDPTMRAFLEMEKKLNKK